MERNVRIDDIKPRPGLRVVLLQAGLTQRDLARRAEIPESYVSQYIHGRMTLSKDEKAKICQALGKPQQEIFE